MNKTISFFCVFTAVAVIFTVIGIIFSDSVATEVYGNANGDEGQISIVIDPGHGGEDGGASSYGDIPEKDLNLSIGLMLCDMLDFFGLNVFMTRCDDVLLYDPNSDYRGHKKSQDLANRLKIAKSVPNAILVSIHMNAFPEAKYRGAQVYYSPNNDSGSVLAELIQSNVRNMIDPQNNRKIKKADKSIYLLNYFEGTGVLIECGFLSNPEEYSALCNSAYRQKLSAVFFGSVLQHISSREI